MPVPVMRVACRSSILGIAVQVMVPPTPPPATIGILVAGRQAEAVAGRDVDAVIEVAVDAKTSMCSGWASPIIGSQASLPITSGTWLSEKLLALSNSDHRRPWLVDGDARGRSGVGREGGLGIFDRHRHPELVVPVLDDAQLRLAGPVEADDILRVDGGGSQLRCAA